MTARRSISAVAAIAGATLAGSAIACGNGTTGVGASVASTLEVTQGNDQAQIVGMPLDTDIVVTVTDSAGMPVGGVSLAFVANSGAGSVAPTTAVTWQPAILAS